MRKFGNWEVTNDAIEWVGDPGDYYIHKSRLHEDGVGERNGMYDWLLHVVEKTWLTRNDILDLNEAFRYAFDFYGVGEAEDLSWEDTMEHQKLLLMRKD